MLKYKVIPLSQFTAFEKEKEALNQAQQLEEKISSYPKPTQNKIKKLLKVFEENGLEIDKTGTVKAITGYFDSEWNILPYTLYCIRAKDKPSDFENFANLISTIKFPKGLLSLTVSKHVKKVARRKVE
ncbi:unnamed protein product [Orchesella dallaii]|uniref:Uncharacterized protein n=1 Tax=Orchesella dallaii TaxID=48710 RepID=A0ABP1RS60_9HEXA